MISYTVLLRFVITTVTGETERGVDEHNDALEYEAKRGKENISELIGEKQEKGANPQYI